MIGATAELAALSGLPRDQDGPVFREPWEAQAFAMAVALRERGVFTAGEWAQALGAAIRRAQAAGDPDTGATYYHHWLAALEGLVVAKRVAGESALSHTRDAWAKAAARTPHGQPITLVPADFAAGLAG